MVKRTLSLVAALLILAGCRSATPPPATPTSAPATPAGTASQELARLAEEYLEAQLELNPLRATSIGDPRYDDRFEVTIAQEWRKRARSLDERCLEQLRALDDAALDGREQAIDYARKSSGAEENRIVAEVERFMAIPSQALAYKAGQLKIAELRARAERELGAAFDVRASHREVLIDGALPLDLLEAKIVRWIVERPPALRAAAEVPAP